MIKHLHHVKLIFDLKDRAEQTTDELKGQRNDLADDMECRSDKAAMRLFLLFGDHGFLHNLGIAGPCGDH